MNLPNVIMNLLDFNKELNNKSRQEMAEYLDYIHDVLHDFVTEHCDRTGEEDWPVAAKDQSNPIVEKAMKILDI